ncbi:MAG: leucyl aminopeptidase family protein, partial [Stellaceae bacterium]
MLEYLIAESASAIPIRPVTEENLPAALARLGEMQRRWVEATGFVGAAGKVALLPDSAGHLAAVLVGLRAGEELWALAGLPDSLPPDVYRLEGDVPAAAATSFALGWALGCYAFTRYKPRDRGWSKLVWPAEADRGLVGRLAGGIGLARDLINTPAEDMGPPELAAAARELAARHGARCHVIVGDELLAENYPTIHAVGRAAAKPPCLVDLVWGDETARKLTLVGKGVCFDTG